MKMDIYTDGSCSQSGKSKGPGGWALVYYSENQKLVIKKGNSESTTNNRMELSAFLNALKEFSNLKENSSFKELNIFSDSAYITNCFRQEWYKNWIRNGWVNAKKKPVANQDLWKEIFKYYFLLVETSKLKIIKVKGHADNQGNILADKHAVNARKELEDNKEESNEENKEHFDINSLY